MRSAVFSLGVLSALHELEVFPHKTDLLSGVSGGTYTITWLYGSHALHGTSFEELLEATGKAQDDLAGRPGTGQDDLAGCTGTGHDDLAGCTGTAQECLAGRTGMIKLTKPGAIAATAANFLIGFPMNLVANGVFGLKANTTTLRRYYEYRLRRAFLGGCSVSWAEVGERVAAASAEGRHLPLPIINATLDLGTGQSEAEKGALASVFELGPLRFGTTGLGFFCDEEGGLPCEPYPARQSLASLERSSAVSGAALDTSFLESVGAGATEKTVGSALNVDLGMWFRNPSYSRSRKACLLKFFPGAHLLRVGSWYKDKGRRGCRILLTDGAHSEGLGAFTIVRRFPRLLFLVDAEYDPKYRFRSYERLKAILLRDLNLRLSITAFDHGPVEPGPIYFGVIESVPQAAAEETAAKAQEISVIYLKIPTRRWVEDRCKLVQLSPDVCNYKETNMAFPFDATTGDQFYDPDQFRAYRDLGMATVNLQSHSIRTALAKAGIN